jgi:hypothetical protein
VSLKKIFIPLLFCILLAQGCSDAPPSGNDGLLIPVDVVRINSTVDSIPQTSSYFQKVDELSGGLSILLGKANNIEASFLIKFLILTADSIYSDLLEDSINITGAYINLVQVYNAGDTLAPFNFTAHKINSPWHLGFTSDSLPLLNYDQNNIILSKTLSDSTNNIIIDNRVAEDWLIAAADTSIPEDNGLYFKPDPVTGKVVGFQALISGLINVPVLNVIIDKPGVYIDTLVFVSNRDLSVVTGTPPALSAENIAVEGGYIINSKLYFNLSEIPENATIHYAELVLTVDTLESFPSETSNYIIGSFIADSSKDSLSTPTVPFTRSGDKFTGNVTTLVIRWLNDRNYGMMLRAADQIDRVDLFAIKGSQSNDVNLRPLLKITYSLIQ